jgi:conjugal transfer pilus assembly protein TraV
VFVGFLRDGLYHVTGCDSQRAGTANVPSKDRKNGEMTMRTLSIATILSLAFVVSGCAMDGLGASSTYACKAPEGITCKSVSGVYYNTLEQPPPSAYQSNRPVEKETGNTKDSPEAYYQGPGLGSPDAAPMFRAASQQSMTHGAPLRTPSRELRIWYAPWVDGEGSAHDESYTYVVVEEGRWRISHKLQQIRQNHAAQPARPQRAEVR